MEGEIILGDRNAKGFAFKASDSEIDAVLEEAIELLDGDGFLTHRGQNPPPEGGRRPNVFYGPYDAQTEHGLWVFPSENERDKGPDGEYYTEDDILTGLAVRFTLNGGLARAMQNVAHEVYDEELERVEAIWLERAGRPYPYRNQPHVITQTLGFYYADGLTRRMFGWRKSGYWNRRCMRMWRNSRERFHQDMVLRRLEDALNHRGLNVRNGDDWHKLKQELNSI